MLGGHFGNDVINVDQPPFTDQEPNVVRFATVKSTGVTASRDGLDPIVKASKTDRVRPSLMAA